MLASLLSPKNYGIANQDLASVKVASDGATRKTQKGSGVKKMYMRIQTRVMWILFVLYVGAVGTSFTISVIKYRSLNFHNRDYALYLQFASKLMDPESSKLYSLNPYGNNCFFFHGTEGVYHFHQSLHFEPIKYFYAILYAVFGSPEILFLFTALVFFLPLLYVALTIQIYTKEQWRVIFMALALYVLYPAALLVPSYDLRPYIFLSPLFFLSVLSIASSRPLWEKLLWFNTMFLAREEALILGLTLIGYAFTRIQEQPMRRKTLTALIAFFLIWALTTSAFLTWTGYPTDFFQTLTTLLKPITQAKVFSLVVGLLIIAVWMLTWRHLRTSVSRQRTSQTLSYSVVFLPLAYLFITRELPEVLLPLQGGISEALTLPRYHLYWVALLGLLLISLPYVGKNPHKKTWIFSLLPIAVFLFWFNMFSHQGVWGIVESYGKQLRLGSDVFALRQVTDQLESEILVDYSTHQAFYDYEHVYVYNRLPWYLVPDNARFYPQNQTIVQALVDTRIEYVVVSRDEFGTVRKFIDESHLSHQLIFENDDYIAIRIFRE